MAVQVERERRIRARVEGVSHKGTDLQIQITQKDYVQQMLRIDDPDPDGQSRPPLIYHSDGFHFISRLGLDVVLVPSTSRYATL
jgi:hypothetical protein